MALFQLKIEIFFIILCTVHHTIPYTQMVPKIYGGHECKPEDYPYIVAIESHPHICVGTLIRMDLVVTTGLCVFPLKYGPEGSTILVKSAFNSKDHMQVRNATGVKVQESFFSYSIWTLLSLYISFQDFLLYNIGLLRLERPFDSSEMTKVVKLPDVGFVAKCKTAVVVGLGQASEAEKSPVKAAETHFKCLDVTLTAEKNCATSEDALRRAPYYYDYVFCGGAPAGSGREAEGDLGGPVICEGTIVGLVTSPKARNASIGYLKIEAYLDFINDNLIQFKAGKIKDLNAPPGKPKQNANDTSAGGQGTEMQSNNTTKAPATTAKSSGNTIWTKILHWNLFFAILTIFFLILL